MVVCDIFWWNDTPRINTTIVKLLYLIDWLIIREVCELVSVIMYEGENKEENTEINKR